jgi:hypothetical protein
MKTQLAIGAVVVAAVSGTVSAAPCVNAPYSTYLSTPGFSCTVTDQTYSGFSFNSSATGSGVAPSADELTVAPNMGMDGPGLVFSSTAIMVTQPASATVTASVDVGLDFTVTAGPGTLLHDAALDVAGSATGAGTGSVTETISSNPPMRLAFSSAMAPPPAGIVMDFSPVMSISVFKDISVDVPAGETGSAEITSVTQAFSEPSAVPEPATFALLCAALSGMGLIRHRPRSCATKRGSTAQTTGHQL